MEELDALPRVKYSLSFIKFIVKLQRRFREIRRRNQLALEANMKSELNEVEEEMKRKQAARRQSTDSMRRRLSIDSLPSSPNSLSVSFSSSSSPFISPSNSESNRHLLQPPKPSAAQISALTATWSPSSTLQLNPKSPSSSSSAKTISSPLPRSPQHNSISLSMPLSVSTSPFLHSAVSPLQSSLKSFSFSSPSSASSSSQLSLPTSPIAALSLDSISEAEDENGNQVPVITFSWRFVRFIVRFQRRFRELRRRRQLLVQQQMEAEKRAQEEEIKQKQSTRRLTMSLRSVRSLPSPLQPLALPQVHSGALAITGAADAANNNNHDDDDDEPPPPPVDVETDSCW